MDNTMLHLAEFSTFPQWIPCIKYYTPYTMKYLAILILVIASVNAQGGAAMGDYQVGDRHVTYQCELVGTGATCKQQVDRTDGTLSAARCTSNNWGTGSGSAKKGECCSTSDDCQDTCNGVICGKSW